MSESAKPEGPKNYLIIDRQYRIYYCRYISGYVRAQAKKGNLSIVNLNNMTGININGSDWSDVQEWVQEFRVDVG